jgi:hypothetical protein
MIDPDMPCGRCDIGVYCEKSMLNKRAREFGNLSTDDRKANMPNCKNHDRKCVGAKHFSEMIDSIDKN